LQPGWGKKSEEGKGENIRNTSQEKKQNRRITDMVSETGQEGAGVEMA